MPYIKHNLKKLFFSRTFWLLTFSDIFTWGFYAIISILSGIYLEGKLGENIVKIVGVGGFIYYVIRGSLSWPISRILDKISSDKDEIVVLSVGCILMGSPFLFYPLISSANQYFFLQLIFSLGVAMNLTPWRKLFATNLVEGKEARVYALYEMMNSFFVAITIFFVGQVANTSRYHFDIIMMSLGLLIMIGGFWASLVITDRSRKSLKNGLQSNDM